MLFSANPEVLAVVDESVISPSAGLVQTMPSSDSAYICAPGRPPGPTEAAGTPVQGQWGLLEQVSAGVPRVALAGSQAVKAKYQSR